MSAEPVAIDLSPDERDMLVRGLTEWVGPTRPFEGLACMMGLRTVDDFYAKRKQLHRALKAEQPLAADDWTWVLVATEIAFASDVLGNGIHWSTTTGIPDQDALRLLRQMQLELRTIVRRSAFDPAPDGE